MPCYSFVVLVLQERFVVAAAAGLPALSFTLDCGGQEAAFPAQASHQSVWEREFQNLNRSCLTCLKLSKITHEGQELPLLPLSLNANILKWQGNPKQNHTAVQKNGFRLIGSIPIADH